MGRRGPAHLQQASAGDSAQRRLPLSAASQRCLREPQPPPGRDADVFACLFRPSLRNHHTPVFSRRHSTSGRRLHILSESFILQRREERRRKMEI